MEPSGSEQLFEDPDPGGKSQDAEARKQTESEQKLSKMTHNALENINVIGQGLKHLFQHQRRRSSVSPHDVQQIQADAEPEVDLESQNACAETDGVPTHPTALNRVLQQIRVPPKMKRGTSLHSRRGKPEAPKGSPQINRKSGQEMATVMQSGRPRSSSTTDAPSSSVVMEIACAAAAAAACLPGDEDSLEEGQVDEAGKALGAISTFQSSPKYGSEEDCSSATSGSVGANSTAGGLAVGASSSRTNTLDMQSSGFDALLHEVQEIRETQARLEESFETLKEHYQRDYSLIMQALQEERYRCERLEEQLNDLTELHQNEILNLKQELASMEEKIAYQSYERARDIQEALEACQTRISKMELQQQQQQVVQLEGLENATARNLLGKLINILLAVMAVLLVFVSTVANCVVPLMKTRSRTFSTLLLVVFIAFLWKHWDALLGYVQRFFSSPR
uniref:Transmembrane and coiled-coil domain family 1 n=1 Tax=Capra hircus TaxID=9925 RepID=A0A8C2RQ52_CAPHI